MDEISLQTITISIITSIIAGLIVAYLLKVRENKIRKQIEEIDSHKEYLEKLSRGNIKLLRSSLALIFICLFLFSVSAIAILLKFTLPLHPQVQLFITVIVISALSIAASLCFFQIKAIIQSANLKQVKKQLKSKRDALTKKIT